MTEVCLELFLLDNALMTYLILLVARLFSRLERRTWGVTLGCALSAVVSALAMLYPVFLSLPVKIALALMLSLLPCKVHTPVEGLRSLGCLLLSTFLFGGLVYALANILESDFTGGVLYAEGSMRAILIGLVLAAVLPRYILSLLRKKRMSIYDVELRIVTEFGESQTRARVDTGNLLFDSITKLPVVVADIGAVKSAIPAQWEQGDWMSHPVKGMTLIPFKSVGGGGMLPALPAKEAYWQKEGVWKACKPCMVAVTKERLTGEFGAIVNADCVDGD